ncbi:RHS repeat-associated core domain-containing protein [Luteimonas sp. TWI1437]|uniref:RHS repeat-associated core domain-containing protein n=1 Tax=unclassified Luteimonas TaxID=2629088 RepID=UPI003207D74E
MSFFAAAIRRSCLTALLLVGMGSVQAQTVIYVHTDELGSVVAETDAAGTIVLQVEYEPFGQRLGVAPNDGLGYGGHAQDTATGLVYMQQRYYDPELGLFLSVDPVTAYLGSIDQFHRYRYASSNPYTLVDPDGRLSGVAGTMGGTSDEGDEPTRLSSVQVYGVRPIQIPVTVPATRGVPWGLSLSAAGGALASGPFLYLFSPHPCGGELCGENRFDYESRAHAPGYWAGDRGAEEWGRRNGKSAAEGRRRFHDIKQKDKGQGGGKGKDNYGTNPETGDVVNPQGEVVGNLNES